jgi:hypothetical protein
MTSIGGNTVMGKISVIGTITFLWGIAWQAAAAEPFYLDGRAPGLAAQRSSRLDLEDAVTVEAWIKPEKLESIGARIVDKGAPGTNDGYLLDTFPGNSLRMIVAEGAISFPANLPSDRWSHVAGVFSCTEGIYKLYLNGKEVASCGHKGINKEVTTARAVDTSKRSRRADSTIYAFFWRFFPLVEATPFCGRFAPVGFAAGGDFSSSVGRSVTSRVLKT